MKIYKELKNIPQEARGSVVVIGNFDGVHRGHQALIAKGAKIAKDEDKKLAILSFEPHPRRLFRPDDPSSRITPPALKAERLECAGVDTLYALKFDWDFASQSADDFIFIVLQEGLGAAHIVVGSDFHFGQMRKGTPGMIESAGIPVTTFEKIMADNGDEISSSAIRQALRQGDIGKANAALGWDWEARGVVIQGDQRGRELGYPTANVKLNEIVHPAYGVYATWAQIEGRDEWLPSATNIGIRPMFEIPTAQIETYIFNFDEDIYGKILRVKPVKRLRSEAKFDSLEALIKQIDQDCENARRVLGV